MTSDDFKTQALDILERYDSGLIERADAAGELLKLTERAEYEDRQRVSASEYDD